MRKSEFKPWLDNRHYVVSSKHAWWYAAAKWAMDHGNCALIGGRQDPDELYLARFWLTAPQVRDDGTLDSSNSVLLHYFAKGDDDGALHDHPWDFSTHILSGGYIESMPDYDNWRDQSYGPTKTIEVVRSERETIEHSDFDLHSVHEPQPDTWTLVTTSWHRRDWGFHPAGEVWQGWQEYLEKVGKL